MKSKKKVETFGLDLDLLWRNAEMSGRVLSRFVGSGVGTALRSLGIVTASDLREIDAVLERLERRVTKLETRKRSGRGKRTAAPSIERRAAVHFE
jgi:hypothetical protein